MGGVAFEHNCLSSFPFLGSRGRGGQQSSPFPHHLREERRGSNDPSPSSPSPPSSHSVPAEIKGLPPPFSLLPSSSNALVPQGAKETAHAEEEEVASSILLSTGLFSRLAGRRERRNGGDIIRHKKVFSSVPPCLEALSLAFMLKGRNSLRT